MLIEIFKVDLNGYIVDKQVHDTTKELPSGFIYVQFPIGIHKPRWDGEGWVGTITQEEIYQAINQPKQPAEIDYLLDLDYRIITIELGL